MSAAPGGSPSLSASASATSGATGGTSGPALTGDFTVTGSTIGGNKTALYVIAAAAVLIGGFYLWQKQRKIRK